MLDTRLPDDTLFLVFEEDFRWWPEETDPDSADEYDRDTQPPLKKEKGGRMSLPPSSRGTPVEEATGAKGEGGKRKKTPKAFSEWHEGRERGDCGPQFGMNWGLKQEVADAIRIANYAHRKN